jgi:2-keto-4-pentenoate hydratase
VTTTDLSRGHIARAADLIAGAYRKLEVLDAFPADCRPATFADAVAMQDELARNLGVPVVGWKVGHANEALRAKFGEGAPVVGRLFDGAVLTSPALIPPADIDQPLVEGELAVRLGADLPPREQDYDVEEVVAAIDAVMPAIEFAEVRTRQEPSLFELTALNAGAFRLILGPEIPDWRNVRLNDLAAELRLDGHVVATHYRGAERSDPLWVMRYLANDLSRRGIGLLRGQVVSTGVILPYLPLGQAAEAVLSVAGIGDVRLEIAEASER